MSILDDVKASLRGVEDEDSALLQRLIDSACRECAQFVYGEIPDYEVVGAGRNPANIPELLNGILILVQADYEADSAKRSDYVQVARQRWSPYRNDPGI